MWISLVLANVSRKTDNSWLYELRYLGNQNTPLTGTALQDTRGVKTNFSHNHLFAYVCLYWKIFFSAGILSSATHFIISETEKNTDNKRNHKLNSQLTCS